MRNLLAYIDARFGEPSTYAGLAAMMAAAHLSVDPGLVHMASLWGMVISAALAVLIREEGTKPPAQVAQDVLEAVVTGIKAMPADVPAAAAQTAKPTQ